MPLTRHRVRCSPVQVAPSKQAAFTLTPFTSPMANHLIVCNYPASFTEALELSKGPVGAFFPGETRNELLKILGVTTP